MVNKVNLTEKINYVEFAANNLAATKAFFTAVFSWQFQDFGEQYSAFSNSGIEGGFYQADLCSKATKGGALIVLLSDDLEACLNRVKAAGGTIVRDIFSFPGGRRFHFTEPSGNELAVWALDQD